MNARIEPASGRSRPNIFEADLWIGGKSVKPESSRYFEDLNPETDEIYALAADGTTGDVDRAVVAADAAFRKNKSRLAREREAWLFRAAEILERRKSEIIDILIDEVGSPLFKAEFEFQIAVNSLRAAAGVPRRVTGKTIPSDRPGALSLTVREPVGVVAGITPFNVPLLKTAKQGGMALACGNAFVLMPSEHAPRVSLFMAEIFAEVGLPDGLFNVVLGNPFQIGDALTSHPLVKSVTFCGSWRIGKHVAELAARDLKPVVLELGGKSPMIVFDDADIDAAVQASVAGIFFFQGQACMGASRMVVQRNIAEAFTAKICAVAGALKMGDLRDMETVVGPIISTRQRQRVRHHIEDAVGKGAHCAAGGEWRSNRCEPTVLSGVTPEMTVYREETFGPVTAVYAFDDTEQAIRIANDTDYGLSGAVFTRDIDKALTVARNVETGMIHVNAASIQDEPHVPFGGRGRSGLGREGTDTDLDAMTEWKWITVQLPAG